MFFDSKEENVMTRRVDQNADMGNRKHKKKMFENPNGRDFFEEVGLDGIVI